MVDTLIDWLIAVIWHIDWLIVAIDTLIDWLIVVIDTLIDWLMVGSWHTTHLVVSRLRTAVVMTSSLSRRCPSTRQCSRRGRPRVSSRAPPDLTATLPNLRLVAKPTPNSWYSVHRLQSVNQSVYYRVSTTSGNLLEFNAAPGNLCKWVMIDKNDIQS